MKPKLAQYAKAYLNSGVLKESVVGKTYTTLDGINGSDKPARNFKEVKYDTLLWSWE